MAPRAERRRRLGLLWGLVVLALSGALLLYWKMPRCGNGSIEAGESCDDGNGLSGDGCSGSCELEILAGPDAGAAEAGDAGLGDGGVWDAGGGDAGPKSDGGPPIGTRCRTVPEMINAKRPGQEKECKNPPPGTVPDEGGWLNWFLTNPDDSSIKLHCRCQKR